MGQSWPDFLRFWHRTVFEKILFCSCTYVCVWVLSCAQLCNPTDCGPPGSSLRGILQARILERVAIPSPRGLNLPFLRLLHQQADSFPLRHLGSLAWQSLKYLLSGPFLKEFRTTATHCQLQDIRLSSFKTFSVFSKMATWLHTSPPLIITAVLQWSLPTLSL